MTSKVKIIVLQFMFLGISKCILGPSQTSFNSHIMAQAKMSLSQINIFMAVSINSMVLLYKHIVRGFNNSVVGCRVRPY